MKITIESSELLSLLKTQKTFLKKLNDLEVKIAKLTQGTSS